MTNQKMRDPAANAEYYRTNTGFIYDEKRLKEHRVQWAAERLNWEANAGDRLLDLGASDGYFIQALPATSPLLANYHGVELNEKAVANAVPLARGHIIAGDVMDPTNWPGMWNRVFIGEILEHLIEPSKLLRMVCERLAPGGTIATTSASGHGEHHEPGNDEHIREWRIDEYVKLHEDSGFEVLQSGLCTVYQIGDIYRMANVVWAKRRGDP